MIDTLQLSKDLGKTFEPEQAEALAKAIGQQGDRFATKSDLEVETTKLRSEIRDLRAYCDVQFSQVRGDIKDKKADLIRWIVGALLINFFGVAGLMIALITNIH